jgi:hypothetical protein
MLGVGHDKQITNKTWTGKSKQTQGRWADNTNRLAFLCNRGGKRPYMQRGGCNLGQGALRTLIVGGETVTRSKIPPWDHQMYLEAIQLDLNPKIFVNSHLDSSVSQPVSRILKRTQYWSLSIKL